MFYKCNKCKKFKALYFFSKGCNELGISYTCKECKKEYDRKYRKRNKEKVKECRNNWINNNKEKLIGYRKKNIKKKKNNDLKRNYGITIKDKLALL